MRVQPVVGSLVVALLLAAALPAMADHGDRSSDRGGAGRGSIPADRGGGGRSGDRGVVRGVSRAGYPGGYSGGDRRSVGRRGEVLDARYHHDRYYPPVGYAVRNVPVGGVWVDHGQSRYWYCGGVWYRPYGPRWVVIEPPLGVYVSFLPPYYTTLWYSGLPYYYANGGYYTYQDERRAYEVVDPPSDAQAVIETPPVEEIYTYPRNGQSDEQQATDRYDCHRWAANQTSFDPTRPVDDVPAPETSARRSEYFRAISACLEGRGYSVK